MRLDSHDDLRTIYRPAKGGAVTKVIDHLDEHCIAFLERSPLMVMSTASADGVCDGSPKGGAPGFARAIDSGRVGWADASGNNRLDSFENVVQNPSVGLLFMIPGLDETLRINGTTELSTDAELCEGFALGGKPAKVVAVVTVVEAYLHCSKALRRAEIWNPETWPAADERPDPMCMLRDHAKLDMPLEDLRDGYEADVVATLTSPGGGTA